MNSQKQNILANLEAEEFNKKSSGEKKRLLTLFESLDLTGDDLERKK